VSLAVKLVRSDESATSAAGLSRNHQRSRDALPADHSHSPPHDFFHFILLCNKQSRQTRKINNGEVQQQKYYKRIQESKL